MEGLHFIRRADPLFYPPCFIRFTRNSSSRGADCQILCCGRPQKRLYRLIWGYREVCIALITFMQDYSERQGERRASDVARCAHQQRKWQINTPSVLAVCPTLCTCTVQNYTIYIQQMKCRSAWEPSHIPAEESRKNKQSRKLYMGNDDGQGCLRSALVITFPQHKILGGRGLHGRVRNGSPPCHYHWSIKALARFWDQQPANMHFTRDARWSIWSFRSVHKVLWKYKQSNLRIVILVDLPQFKYAFWISFFQFNWSF